LEKHFPLDLEGLPKKSVIVGHAQSHKIAEYGFIQFYPYWGFNFFRINYIPDLIPQEPIETLKHLLRDGQSDPSTGAKSVFDELNGYQVFVFKNHPYHETTYLNNLQSQHGIILKDYSKSFCKMELVNVLDDNESKSDKICN